MRSAAMTTLTAPPLDEAALAKLQAWAQGVFLKERQMLVPRVARVAEGRVVGVRVERKLGMRAAQQVAAVVMRTASEGEWIATLMPARTNEKSGAKEIGAFIDARTRAGGCRVRIMRIGRGQFAFKDLGPADAAAIEDWSRPGFPVDPAIEQAAADAGVRGAQPLSLADAAVSVGGR